MFTKILKLAPFVSILLLSKGEAGGVSESSDSTVSEGSSSTYSEAGSWSYDEPSYTDYNHYNNYNNYKSNSHHSYNSNNYHGNRHHNSSGGDEDPRILFAIVIIVGGAFTYTVVHSLVNDCKKKAEK